MKAVVLYASATKNTEKIAKAISEKIKADYIKIGNNTVFNNLNINDYDFIFLGTGVYAGMPHAKIGKFLNSLEKDTAKKYALFITWGGVGDSFNSICRKLKALLIEKNQTVIDNYYGCYGKAFGLMKPGHPDDQELKEAGEWAVKVLS